MKPIVQATKIKNPTKKTIFQEIKGVGFLILVLIGGSVLLTFMKDKLGIEIKSEMIGDRAASIILQVSWMLWGVIWIEHILLRWMRSRNEIECEPIQEPDSLLSNLRIEVRGKPKRTDSGKSLFN